MLLAAAPAFAQEPPPKIGPFVVDLHGTFPRFPSEQELADSRGMSLAELPGVGLGAQLGAHVYVFTWKAVTIGLGGEVAIAHASQTPSADMTGVRAATETFKTAAGELSLNFGTGHGWSYISGGLGRSIWSVVPAGSSPLPTDSDPIHTVNYGGGARWFAKTHLAFSFDVRFYQMDPGSPYVDPSTGAAYPGSPRTTLLIIGAGVSVK
jgi:hypothetical protein